MHCKKWSHKIDNCWRKHPEIAPSEWKNKAEELKKQAEERKKYEEEMDLKTNLAYASTSRKEKKEARSKSIGPLMEEWEEASKRFEAVERFITEEKKREREKKSSL